MGADLKKLPRNRDGQIFAERRVRTHDLLAYFKWSNPIPPSRKIAAWHGCEICFVLEGHVVHEFFGANDESLESVTIRAGEVSLLNYMEPHRNEASKTGAFISYNINLADHSIPTERAYKLFNAHKVVAQDLMPLSSPSTFLTNIKEWLLGTRQIPQLEVDHFFSALVSNAINLREDGRSELVDRDLGGLEAVRKCLEASYSEAHTIDDLAELAQLSRFHFIRKFKRHFGCTPFEYLHFVRMNRAMQMLVSGNFKVTDVALEVGFNDISFFLYKFKQHYGKSPGQVCGTKICTPPASLPIL